LHLIDFEQLKIENQTYNEKIEERNEELLRLRKKITTIVQVLTHVKEKLQFCIVGRLLGGAWWVRSYGDSHLCMNARSWICRTNIQTENQDLAEELISVEEQVAVARDRLPTLKQHRDRLRILNTNLKESNGMLGNRSLLRDYELRTDQAEGLKEQITNLRTHHADITGGILSTKRKMQRLLQQPHRRGLDEGTKGGLGQPLNAPGVRLPAI
jgi:hypothetical protein